MKSSLKRYGCDGRISDDVAIEAMYEDDDGEWVRFSDIQDWHPRTECELEHAYDVWLKTIKDQGWKSPEEYEKALSHYGCEPITPTKIEWWVKQHHWHSVKDCPAKAIYTANKVLWKVEFEKNGYLSPEMVAQKIKKISEVLDIKDLWLMDIIRGEFEFNNNGLSIAGEKRKDHRIRCAYPNGLECSCQELDEEDSIQSPADKTQKQERHRIFESQCPDCIKYESPCYYVFRRLVLKKQEEEVRK